MNKLNKWMYMWRRKNINEPMNELNKGMYIWRRKNKNEQMNEYLKMCWKSAGSIFPSGHSVEIFL